MINACILTAAASNIQKTGPLAVIFDDTKKAMDVLEMEIF